jgi:hypothetical protein
VVNLRNHTASALIPFPLTDLHHWRKKPTTLQREIIQILVKSAASAALDVPFPGEE